MNRLLATIQSSEIYSPEIDPCEKRDVISIDNAIAIDAGYMRLAHVVCDGHLQQIPCDPNETFPVADELFSDIPVVFVPRFKRNNGNAGFIFILALTIASIGALVGMFVAIALN